MIYIPRVPGTLSWRKFTQLKWNSCIRRSGTENTLRPSGSVPEARGKYCRTFGGNSSPRMKHLPQQQLFYGFRPSSINLSICWTLSHSKGATITINGGIYFGAFWKKLYAFFSVSNLRLSIEVSVCSFRWWNY